MPTQGKNHGRGNYHVYSPNDRRVTKQGKPLDRAAAEQLAASSSASQAGVWRVEPADDSRPVAKFENGKRIR